MTKAKLKHEKKLHKFLLTTIQDVESEIHQLMEFSRGRASHDPTTYQYGDKCVYFEEGLDPNRNRKYDLILKKNLWLRNRLDPVANPSGKLKSKLRYMDCL